MHSSLSTCHTLHIDHTSYKMYTLVTSSTKHMPHTHLIQIVCRMHGSKGEACLLFYNAWLVNWLSHCRPVYHLSPELGHQMKTDSRKLWNIPKADAWDLHTLKTGTHFNSPRNAGLYFNYPAWTFCSLWLLGAVLLGGRAVVRSSPCPGMRSVGHLSSSPCSAMTGPFSWKLEATQKTKGRIKKGTRSSRVFYPL